MEMSQSNTFSKKIPFVSVIYQKSTELLSLKSEAIRECLKPSSTLWLQYVNMATAIYPVISQGISTWFIYNWFFLHTNDMYIKKHQGKLKLLGLCY